MDNQKSKPNISLLTIEAYAMPSSTYVPDDSHCFVVSLDRGQEWKNYGGGWSDSRPKTKVATNQAYCEWLMEFIPPSNINKCGLEFGVNGVCHTYASREMLLGQSDVSVREAAKDYVCVFFYGKYGLGLNQLKQLLTSSYNKVVKEYNDPYDALNKVLQRINNYLDDELKAWRQVGIEYAQIPIDDLLAKNPSGGLATARRRLQDFVMDREKVYQEYLDGKISKWDISFKVRGLIQTHSDNYLNMLCDIRYITETEKTNYSNNIRNFLSRFYSAVQAQEKTIQESGVLDLGLAATDL